ncbi:MAG: hypothetical protein HOQ05_13530 [Corynebacteriales bacterium]|nr:hypothetical protein [Mycobacteriales bacterium]
MVELVPISPLWGVVLRIRTRAVLGAIAVAVIALGPTPTPAVAADTPLDRHKQECNSEKPPWPAPADPYAASAAAGIQMMDPKDIVMHIHAHVDIYDRGEKVTIPANIGIDAPGKKVSYLHTHDETGVVHIEGPQWQDFSLGQFFTEWGVPLRPDGIGGLCADDENVVTTYVNGNVFYGDPASIIFRDHDQIALVYGPPGYQPPIAATYDWSAA